MDFIERLLGVAPDGGSGALELLLFLTCPATTVVWRSVRQSWRRGRG